MVRDEIGSGRLVEVGYLWVLWDIVGCLGLDYWVIGGFLDGFE